MTRAAVWFDLDGTLLETAPDLIAAVNATLQSSGFAPLPYDVIRAHISCGSRAMMALGLGTTKDDPRVDDLVPIFSAHYAANVCVQTTWFTGMEAIIKQIERAGVPWGIITNKAEKFARPLILQMGLAGRIAALVAGDTLAHNKPAPEPLWHAAKLSHTDPAASIFIGDNRVDIAAGRAAGMATCAAAYGYVHADDDPAQWGADFVAHSVDDLAVILEPFLTGAGGARRHKE